MSTIEFDEPPSWSLDASETGESKKCQWAVAVGLIAWKDKGVPKYTLFINGCQFKIILCAFNLASLNSFFVVVVGSKNSFE